MTPKDIKTVEVEKNDYKIYLRKAIDFHDTMQSAREASKWTAVGLNAVHCAISCCDAILTFHLGIRSAGEDHMQATELLQRLPKDVENGQASIYRRIIAKKNLIAYENREFRQSDAFDILKITERFYAWATKKLPE